MTTLTRVNLSFQDLYDTEREVIFCELDLAVAIEEFLTFEIVFSHDVDTVLINDKVFSNLRQELRSRPLSLPLPLNSANEDQADKAINLKETTEFATSSCGRYIAVNQRIGLGSDTALRLDVFEVKSGSVSWLRQERMRNLLARCVTLQVDFHPYLPKLAMTLWDETDKPNQLGNSCERVRCVIWDIDDDHLYTIGETLDFYASFGE